MRLADFQRELKRKNIPLSLIFNLEDQLNHNFFYFTRYDGYGCLVVPASGNPVVITPPMEEERARATTPLRVVKYATSFSETLRTIMGNPKRVGLDYGSVSLLFHRTLRKRMKHASLIDVSAIIRELRMVKTETELTYLQRACAISDSILRSCFDHFRKFKTEKDVYRFLDQETRNHNCVFSFDPIVASGSNASMPHHKPQNVRLKQGFCVIDFAVKYKGYCSDTTRTVYLGKPSLKELQFYQFILDTQEYITTQYVPGRKCADLFHATVKALGKQGKYFIHGLGHGVGVEIHEPPSLGPKSDEVLKENMTVTNEPGVYFPKKLGIRIEDTLVVTNNRPKVITRIPRVLRIIK